MRWSKIVRFTLGSRILAIKINVWNQKLHTHYGITNETPNGKFVPFWDFIEDIPWYYAHTSLRVVQEKFGLGDIFLLQTYPKNSYRAFCFTEIEWHEYISLLASTKYIDPSYLKHSVMRGRAVIRITEKIGTENKVIEVIDGHKHDIQSKHHRAFLSALYPQIPRDYHPPDKVKVRLSKYESFR